MRLLEGEALLRGIGYLWRLLQGPMSQRVEKKKGERRCASRDMFVSPEKKASPTERGMAMQRQKGRNSRKLPIARGGAGPSLKGKASDLSRWFRESAYYLKLVKPIFLEKKGDRPQGKFPQEGVHLSPHRKVVLTWDA